MIEVKWYCKYCDKIGSKMFVDGVTGEIANKFRKKNHKEMSPDCRNRYLVQDTGEIEAAEIKKKLLENST